MVFELLGSINLVLSVPLLLRISEEFARSAFNKFLEESESDRD